MAPCTLFAAASVASSAVLGTASAVDTAATLAARRFDFDDEAACLVSPALRALRLARALALARRRARRMAALGSALRSALLLSAGDA